eukprot:scaffold18980_cov163-Skeletonema_dohrnii-CCMP3373.AAC.1
MLSYLVVCRGETYEVGAIIIEVDIGGVADRVESNEEEQLVRVDQEIGRGADEYENDQLGEEHDEVIDGVDYVGVSDVKEDVYQRRRCTRRQDR